MKIPHLESPANHYKKFEAVGICSDAMRRSRKSNPLAIREDKTISIDKDYIYLFHLSQYQSYLHSHVHLRKIHSSIVQKGDLF